MREIDKVILEALGLHLAELELCAGEEPDSSEQGVQVGITTSRKVANGNWKPPRDGREHPVWFGNPGGNMLKGVAYWGAKGKRGKRVLYVQHVYRSMTRRGMLTKRMRKGIPYPIDGLFDYVLEPREE